MFVHRRIRISKDHLEKITINDILLLLFNYRPFHGRRVLIVERLIALKKVEDYLKNNPDFQLEKINLGWLITTINTEVKKLTDHMIQTGEILTEEQLNRIDQVLDELKNRLREE